jgi:hypothetical protein
LDIVIIIGVGLLLVCLAISPSLLIWSASSLWLPKWYALPPIRMTLLCLLLSFISAAILNLELESGVMSVGPLIFALSLAWSLILIPIIIVVKYYQHRKTKNT